MKENQYPRNENYPSRQPTPFYSQPHSSQVLYGTRPQNPPYRPQQYPQYRPQNPNAPPPYPYGLNQMQTTVTYNLGPSLDYCKVCKKNTGSTLVYENGAATYVICIILLAFGLWLGCCLIPFGVQGCKDKLVYCSECSVQKAQQCLI